MTATRPARTAAAAALMLLAAFMLCGSSTAARKLQQESQQATFMIGFNGTAPSREALRGAVAAAGCTLGFFHSESGIAVAKCPTGTTLTVASFPASLNVGVVVQDEEQGPSDDEKMERGPNEGSKMTAPAAGSTAGNFYTGPLTGAAGDPNDANWTSQWAPRSIRAPVAWAKGINGRCTRVAIVTGAFTGRSPFNPDIINKFDMNASKSFVDGYPFGAITNLTATNGASISGIIGAEANNGIGVVGVAYGATLIGVQVFGPASFTPASKVVEGVIYAAERRHKGGAGADIINLGSFGRFDKANETQLRDLATGRNQMEVWLRAFAFANKNGVLIVAGARAETINNITYYNMDSLSATTVQTACELPNVLCVTASAPSPGLCPPSNCRITGNTTVNNVTRPVYSATACTGGLNLTGANYSRLAASAAYGKAVDVTAPGGDSLARNVPCYAVDWIMSTFEGNNTFNQGWTAGINSAMAHVSALAALYTQKAAMDKGALETTLCSATRTKTYVSPAQIKQAIIKGAVLPPGNKQEMRNFFGAGIIDVPRTLGL